MTNKTPEKLAQEYSDSRANYDNFSPHLAFLAGYKAALAELEQREREAFEAGRSQYQVRAGIEQDADIYNAFEWLTYDDYKKSRGER